VHCLESLNDLSIFWLFRGITQRPRTAPPAYECYAGFIHDDDFALPSWCPSWTRSGINIARLLDMTPQDRWSASGGLGSRLGRPSPLVVTLEGFTVSRVVWCSTNIVTRQSAGVLIEEAVDYLLHCPRHLPLSPSAQDLDLTRLVWCVLELLVRHPCFNVGFVLKWRIKIPPKLSHTTQSFLEQCNLWDSLLEFFGPVYLRGVVPDLFASVDLEVDTRIATEDYEFIVGITEHQMSHASDGCCLFVTDGGMLGTGFPGMMAGDLVCILFGGRVPYVLRPTEVEGQYLLIGECYVDELMEGEAMHMGLQEQKFTLV
jgi:hypothetical protein